jgi:hypothetical protein
MAATSEILAKLGIDTKDIPKDLQEADKFFAKFSKDLEKGSEKAGDEGGKRFAKSFGSQIAGQARGAIAAAIGLSAQGIADKLAGWLVGGTAKEWEEFGKIADENSKIIGERIRENLAPRKVVENLEKELANAQKKIDELFSGGKGGGGKLSIFDAALISAKTILGIGAKELDQRVAIKTAENDRLKIQGQLAEARKAAAAEEEKLSKAIRDYDFESATLEGKKTMLKSEIVKLNNEIQSGTLKEKDVTEKLTQLLAKALELRRINKEIVDQTARKEEEAADKKKKALEDERKQKEKLLTLEKQRDGLTKKAGDLKDTLADRSKLTIGELSQINESGFGVGNDAIFAKRKAEEVQKAQAESDRLRLSGDIAGSAEKLAQADALKNELAGAGFLKSSENDSASIVEQLKETEEELAKVLKSIDSHVEGKFVNQ